MKQIQKGFTLIELMIVVAIIGILAAVAIPAYQDYVVKAKLSKVQTNLDSLKTAFALYYQENSGFPNDAQPPVTELLQDQPLVNMPPAGPETVWTSIGLKRYPAFGKEINQIVYNPGPTVVGPQVTDFELLVTLQNIKATQPSIDTVVVQVTPTGLGSTNVQWNYSCTGGTGPGEDPILTKYFKLPGGGDCAAVPFPIN